MSKDKKLLKKARKALLKWVEKKGATNIDEYNGEKHNSFWDYYRSIDFHVADKYYSVYFKSYYGKADIKLSYVAEKWVNREFSIEEFESFKNFDELFESLK